MLLGLPGYAGPVHILLCKLDGIDERKKVMPLSFPTTWSGKTFTLKTLVLSYGNFGGFKVE
jgi:hypothetical protein